MKGSNFEGTTRIVIEMTDHEVEVINESIGMVTEGAFSDAIIEELTRREVDYPHDTAEVMRALIAAIFQGLYKAS